MTLFGLTPTMSAVNLTTRLTKSECIRRIELCAGRDRGFGWSWEPWQEGTIAAKIRGDRFRLFAWGPLFTAISFAPFFQGRLEQGHDEVRIRGRFRLHRLVQGFVVIWFGGLAAMVGLMLLLPDESWIDGMKPPTIAALAPIGMMAVGAFLLRLNRWFVRGQMESMRRFLQSELQAQEEGIPDPNQPAQTTRQGSAPSRG